VIEARNQLVDDEVRAVAALVEAATKADGVAPLSEQAMLQIRASAPITHLFVREDGRIVGYAQLDAASQAAELVVHPDHRRRGLGRELVAQLMATTDESRLKIWAHGDLPAAQALAATAGLEPVRSLWQMGRPLTDDLPDPRVPDGIVVDTFVPGTDDDAWVALNARAFADHPEQGRWTLSDFHDRTKEPWFDPAGFFVARRGPSMVAFHWTKVRDDSTGEVYVVGVDPRERGHGLGRALTLVGLHHLNDIGLARVILYVDESNLSAVRLYRGLGFERFAVDVMYASSSPE
jgi:mycothiol synthase